MKRILLYTLAALLAILVYPSIHAHAASPKAYDGGPVVVVPPGGDLPPISLTDNQGGDNGDADDLTGLKGGTASRGLVNGRRGERPQFVLILKTWWRLMIWIR